MPRLVLSLVLMIAATGCTSAQVTSEPFDLAAARAQIEASNRQFGEGFRTDNADLIVALYTEDAQFLEPAAALRTGTDAIRAYWAATMPFVNDMELRTLSLEGTRDVLYEVGEVDTMGPTPDGAGYVQRDKYVNVWRLQPDGSYRIAIDMWSSRGEQ